MEVPKQKEKEVTVVSRISIPFAVFSVALAVPCAAIDFNREIRPILSNHCFQCHGPDAEHREADLRLDTEDSATADRGGYAVISRTIPDESELLIRIDSDDPDAVMPPPDAGKDLTDQQRQLLKQWVLDGGKWAQHWAYQRPVPHITPLLPTGADWKERGSWPNNWIDRFIAKRLAAESLIPSPDAYRVTLARRASFDLTGLPPRPERVEAFVKDADPHAFDLYVDELLVSPAFGERMAMYWLDLVRFADTVGYHGDQDHNVSPYRDYVIDSFNDNKPFDLFTIEQLAGDLLPGSTVEQQIATCYNRLLQTSHEGGVQPKEYLAIYAADRVRNVSAVWMGATLGCAQCHDHKFDPYTSRDFYTMAAFFADVDDAKHFKVGTNNLPTKRPPEIDVLSRWQRERIAALEKSGDEARDAMARLKAESRRTMVTVALKEPRTVRLLPRGNWLDDSGPVVEPAIPEFLGSVKQSEKARASRLDLANWLTDPEGSGLLTARVFVNRLWYLFFGSGLSKSLDDFGGQGEAPVHPELLDRLAWEFVESGWDVKHVVRLIVLSRTYQQSSQQTEELQVRDPYNRLYARQSRYRLDAEMVRDNAMAVSGLLVRQVGGSSVKPYQPAGYYRHLNFPQRKYQHDGDTRQYRRGLYVHWQRQFLHPMMKAFDAPSREECTAARPRSNNALAALTLLNDPTFVEAARALAARVIQAEESDDARTQLLMRMATSRNPTEHERSVLSKLLETNRQYYDSHADAAMDLITVGATPRTPAIPPAELASWTMAARAVLNLNEVITRN